MIRNNFQTYIEKFLSQKLTDLRILKLYAVTKRQRTVQKVLYMKEI